MGPKLDFVREDVPNVRSLTFLSFICSYATFSPFLFSPPATTLILTPLSLSFSIFFSPSPLSLSLFALFALWTTARSFPGGVSSFFLLLSVLRFRFPRRRSTTSRRFSTFRGTMHISPIFMEFLVDFFHPRRHPRAPLFFALPLFRLRACSIFSSARSHSFPFRLRFPPSLFSYCPLCTHPSHSPFVGGVFLSCGATCVSLTILRSCPRDCGFGLQAQIFLLFPSSDQPSINTSVRRKSFHICKFYI